MGPLAVALTPIVSDTARLRFRSRRAAVTGSIAAIGSPPASIDAWSAPSGTPVSEVLRETIRS